MAVSKKTTKAKAKPKPSIKGQLGGAELKKKLKTIPDWEVNAQETQISRGFCTNSFVEGLSLVARIVVHSEVLGHHPDIELSHSRVKVKLTTHDVKGLSNKDFELAKRIDLISG